MIFDFDGTLASLQINWVNLRSRLGVSRISELWTSPNDARWKLVTQEELEASRTALANQTLLAKVESPFVIISNNSSIAINCFLGLHQGTMKSGSDFLILGREELCGPKEDLGVFSSAIDRALAFIGRSPHQTDYFGDQEYELGFASRLGLSPVEVRYFATT